jgi:hypothetical protein
MAVNSVLSFDTPVSINDLRTAIPLYGPHITMVVKSEPGVGKSTLLKMIAEDNGDKWRSPRDTGDFSDDKYDYIYVDCPVKDAPDTGMHVPVHATKTLEYYVSSLFKLGSKKPKVIMLDEFMKAPKMMQKIFTRLAQERMAGDEPLPKGSYVFCTSNNETDGVGDGMLAHAGNRVMIVRMKKPSAAEWNVWAGENGVHRLVRSWVAMNPRCLASYLDGGQEDNPYIFKPTGTLLSFVSPRSLAQGAHTAMAYKQKVSQAMTTAALAGSIGQSAAESMAAFISLEKEIITTSAVIADPEGVTMPEKPAALFMMMFNALDDIQVQDDLSQFMKFINRVASTECKTVFFTMLCQTKRTMRLAKNNTEVAAWAKKNLDFLI